MAVNSKIILGNVPGLMATGVIARNLKEMPKVSPKAKIPPVKKTIKIGVENIISVGMIGATGQAINAL